MSTVLHFWATVFSWGLPTLIGLAAIGAAALIVFTSKGNATNALRMKVVGLTIVGAVIVLTVMALGMAKMAHALLDLIFKIEVPQYGRVARGLLGFFVAGFGYAWWRFGEVAVTVALSVGGAAAYGMTQMWPNWFSHYSQFLTTYSAPPVASILASYTAVALFVLYRACPVRGRVPSKGKGKR